MFSIKIKNCLLILICIFIISCYFQKSYKYPGPKENYKLAIAAISDSSMMFLDTLLIQKFYRPNQEFFPATKFRRNFYNDSIIQQIMSKIKKYVTSSISFRPDSLLFKVLTFEEVSYINKFVENSHFLLLPVRFEITDKSGLTECYYIFNLYDLKTGSLVAQKNDVTRIKRSQLGLSKNYATRLMSETAIHLFRNKYDELFQ